MAADLLIADKALLLTSALANRWPPLATAGRLWPLCE
jgi:hypothetical protein